mmetsp:Transcript_46443/g.104375  ORF Transcript_46443/g.104375 Transcript_46443/m.104375 type:complete len:251 (-) Transcript_46443:1059-1811(-)
MQSRCVAEGKGPGVTEKIFVLLYPGISVPSGFANGPHGEPSTGNEVVDDANPDDELQDGEHHQPDVRVELLTQGRKCLGHLEKAQQAEEPENANSTQHLVHAQSPELLRVGVRAVGPHVDERAPVKNADDEIHGEPCLQVRFGDHPRPHFHAAVAVVASEEHHADVQRPEGCGDDDHDVHKQYSRRFEDLQRQVHQVEGHQDAGQNSPHKVHPRAGREDDGLRPPVSADLGTYLLVILHHDGRGLLKHVD